MTNPLIQARDRFAARHPESRQEFGGRDWGVIDTGPQDHDRPALLLLPGTLGRGDIFWQQIESIDEVRILALSYPEAGGIVDWVADIEALLDEHGIERAAILGSSLGGYLAQAFAATHPARVSHLFAANTLSSVAGIDARPPYSLDLWAAPIEDLRAGFAMAMRNWGQTHPEQGDLVALLLAESAGRITEGEMRARLSALKGAGALPGDPRPAEETTVIESADDPLLPPPMQAGVRDRFAGSPVFRFAWGGHFPYVLRPELYSGLIRARLGLDELPSQWRDGLA